MGEAVPVQGRGQILGPRESAIVYGDGKTWRTKVGRVRAQGRGAERRKGARGPWGSHWGWSGGTRHGTNALEGRKRGATQWRKKGQRSGRLGKREKSQRLSSLGNGAVPGEICFLSTHWGSSSSWFRKLWRRFTDTLLCREWAGVSSALAATPHCRPLKSFPLPRVGLCRKKGGFQTQFP